MNSSTIESATTDIQSQSIPVYFSSASIPRTSISRKTFPPQVKEAIRQLHTLDRRWNWIIGGPIVLWLSAAFVAVQSSSLLVRIAAYLVGGLGLSSLPVLAHEASHNLFTKRSQFDQWLGFICGLPILFSANAYRVVHVYHHKYVRSQQDPDDIENITKRPALLRLMYPLLFFFGAYPYLIVVPLNAMRWGTLRQRVIVSLEVLAMAAIITACWMFLPVDWMLHAWLIPLLFAAQLVNLRGVAEHGMTAPDDDVLSTRTIVTTPLLSFMMCNINYHIEHHLYPGVPWYRLPRLHKILVEYEIRAGASVYPGYVDFLKDFLRALKHGPAPGVLLLPRSMRAS